MQNKIKFILKICIIASIVVSYKVTGAAYYVSVEIKPIETIKLTLKNLKTYEFLDIGHIK